MDIVQPVATRTQNHHGPLTTMEARATSLPWVRTQTGEVEHWILEVEYCHCGTLEGATVIQILDIHNSYELLPRQATWIPARIIDSGHFLPSYQTRPEPGNCRPTPGNQHSHPTWRVNLRDDPRTRQPGAADPSSMSAWLPNTLGRSDH